MHEFDVANSKLLRMEHLGTLPFLTVKYADRIFVRCSDQELPYKTLYAERSPLHTIDTEIHGVDLLRVILEHLTNGKRSNNAVI